MPSIYFISVRSFKREAAAAKISITLFLNSS
jgi:hypothetical protein